MRAPQTIPSTDQSWRLIDRAAVKLTGMRAFARDMRALGGPKRCDAVARAADRLEADVRAARAALGNPHTTASQKVERVAALLTPWTAEPTDGRPAIAFSDER